MTMNPELTERGWEISYDGILQSEDEPPYTSRVECERAIQSIYRYPGFDRNYARGIDYACGIDP